MYATPEDLEPYYGPIPDEKRAAALTLIEQAEAQIAQRVPDLPARLTAGLTSEPLVRQVVAELVTEVLRNPEGYVTGTRSVTKGPFSSTVSGTRSAGATAGLLTLTRRHLKLLGGKPGASTISVSAGDDALRHTTRRRGLDGLGAGLPEGVHFGCVWPLPWDGSYPNGVPSRWDEEGYRP